ncbi:hypothetical protein, partial [Pseudomonas sp. FSL R10-0056]|uniref:hypothetical protein n=1 Tax=Pseudomonas sp. FSL R10-0056 TaxID=2662192 RepID=UPI001C498D26
RGQKAVGSVAVRAGENAPGAAAMNQTDEFVIDGSEPTKPGRGVRRVNYTPLAVLAGVTVATVAALLGYRVGKKRGKGD